LIGKAKGLLQTSAKKQPKNNRLSQRANKAITLAEESDDLTPA
jgi:hypothetical protein